jgi:phosphoribosylformimino-5-aminoimidazole carboxamide ribotide isomerase
MEIIPAIDIISGKCVRLVKGDYRLKKVYSDDPVKVAKFFEREGMKKLHLVDLDGTREGKIKNWGTIEKIAKNTNLEIEFGGGIRDEKDIKRLLSLGINRVILGSLVLKEPKKFEKIAKKFPDKIIVAVDTFRKRICYRGWQENVKIDIDRFLKNLVKLGIKTILCTDIERDGTLKGPNFTLYKRLVSKFPNLKIIASGGIRNIQDLKRLSQIGVAGAIVGKAIYEKKISLSDLKSFI